LYRQVLMEERNFSFQPREADLQDIVIAWINDESNSAHRFDIIRKYLPAARMGLDMASGCGTAVFYGLMNGFEMQGIDPEKWKHEFTALKASEYGYPKDWLNCFQKGVGENLPYSDASFDFVTSYQTLEHVESPYKTISEMLRVTKIGGGIHMQCPDYCGTYEPHYRLPWVVGMPNWLIQIYLNLLHRPITGLKTINFVRRAHIRKYLKRYLEKHSELQLIIIDLDKEKFKHFCRQRNIPQSDILFILYRIGIYLWSIFRKGIQINILILIKKK